ncbi:MAG: flagellar biosynthesis anti-sigma factor FlgM [Myxococcales bacterium]|nr:flagellar biosynthesis anti-sigma factor FlgM [Myxococcales bacterium]
MRVPGSGVPEIGKAAVERPRSQPATGKHAIPSDAVVVSTQATALSAAAGERQAARAERVADVRARVQSGGYRVDVRKLAERIADDELARGARR